MIGNEKSASMKLLSINIGKQQVIITRNQSGPAGIFKQPLSHPVHISSLGLEGDYIASTRHHGGPDQAVYIYGTTDYAWWELELGRKISPGTFGENLTISELESAHFYIGDRLQMDGVVLEVTAPRIPCGTFAARMGDPEFVKRFRVAERPGLYCRVIHAGVVEVGDEVSVMPFQGSRVGLIEIYRDYYEKQANVPELRRLLNAPVAARARESLEERLRKALSTGG